MTWTTHYDPGTEFIIEMPPTQLVERFVDALRNEHERCAQIAEQQAGKNKTIGDTKAVARAIREGR